MTFYFRFKYSEFDDLFPQIKLGHVKSLPIIEAIKNGNAKLNGFASIRLKNTSEINTIRLNLIGLLANKYDLNKLSSKLSNWIDLELKDFLGEFKKAKIKLTLSEEVEWIQYFNEQKCKVQNLQSELNKTDKEIDQMVYELYGLTKDEIKIVEESV